MIRIENLHKSFDDKLVLRGVDLEILDGEVMVILGSSGCGKSVLLKHLIGLMMPDEGSVIVDGTDITSLSKRALYEVRRNFGMLFQSAALFDSMTVYENVSLGLTEHSPLSEAEKREIVRDKLELVGLSDTEEMSPSELSGGMRKRVGLARAICMDPAIVLYDEPTTGLDPVIGDTINDLIQRLQSRLNITSVVVTHDMRSAFMVADRMAMLSNGKIHFVGTSKEIEASDDPEVREFLAHR
ncbi:MAG: ABC transporter ATP-binding protein [candidate division Zixibacteria bacterium]|nr:ABC transporter ATP-binding protein [candidate division Zixibacteria bacterium]MBU1469384.1 ABC transporter ATP-binding protein [candidate division Zixibacteria bacterium]MBU2626055.1 ABC transporter ATP-binding protein [candidate division Zixibacteria bacterium]